MKIIHKNFTVSNEEGQPWIYEENEAGYFYFDYEDIDFLIDSLNKLKESAK